MILSGVDLELSKLASKNFNLINSKGISVLFLVIAMMLMVTIGYVFSYLIPQNRNPWSSLFSPPKHSSLLNPEWNSLSVMLMTQTAWTTPALLNNLNTALTTQELLVQGDSP